MNITKKAYLKSIAILLTIIMVFTFGLFYTPVNAATKSNTDLNRFLINDELSALEQSDTLTDDGLHDALRFLDTCGIDINNIELNKNKLTLDVEVGDISNSIIINSANNELIKMEVFEGDKHNVIELDDANNLYVDGEKIEVTEEEIVDIDEISANAQARYGSCPYGKAADYTYYAKQTTKNVKLAKLIAKCTVATIAIAVGVLVPGAAAGITSGVASFIASEAVLSDGDVLKIKASVYYHKSKKKFMVTNSIGCQKEICSFYGKNPKHRLYKKTLWLYNHVNGA